MRAAEANLTQHVTATSVESGLMVFRRTAISENTSTLPYICVTNVITQTSLFKLFSMKHELKEKKVSSTMRLGSCLVGTREEDIPSFRLR